MGKKGKEKKLPLRQCVGCRQSRPKKELIRVIRTPEGQVELDAVGRKNGRGAYLCPDTECFRKAVKSKGLERALKIHIPEDIYDHLEEELNTIDTEK